MSLKQRFVRWLLRGVRLESQKFGDNTITVDPGGVDVIRWSATQASVAAGDLGMNTVTGRPQAFVSGVNKSLATTTDVVPTLPTVPATLTNASAQYTILATDSLIRVDVSGGALAGAILMPATPSAGELHTVKNIAGNAAVQPFTVSGNGNNIEDPNNAQTFGATASMRVQGASVTWTFDGTRWAMTHNG